MNRSLHLATYPLTALALALMLASCGDSGSLQSGSDSSTGDTNSADTIGNTDSTDSTVDSSSTDDGATDDNSDTGNVSPVIDQPNILLVITDDQGLDSSAQYSLGNDVPNTPVIDALAANGIIYDNVWASPSCSPTRAALLTGKHGINNGVMEQPGVLEPEVGTIQAFLDSTSVTAEYSTSVFGKWQVGDGSLDHPAQLGVDHFAGNLRGISDYFDWTLTTNGESTQSSTYNTTALVDLASEWIAGQDSPWFTWLAFTAPHSPFHLPPDGFNTRNLSGTDADIAANSRDYYLSAMETLDTELGRLLDSMDPATRANTVVMVIGDNGTPRNVIDTAAFIDTNHGKGSLFEGGLRVPLVISGARVERTGVRESGLVSITDFFPTIAELSGADDLGSTDGQSLVASFSADNAITREFAYSDYETNNVLGSGWAVRSDTHKYIAYDNDTEALYDLSTDPDEAVNLISTGGNTQAIVSSLRDFGLQVRGETVSTKGSGAPFDITERLLVNPSADCADHVLEYFATATDAGTGAQFDSSLAVSVNNTQCVFNTNAIPNHTFNDGAGVFPNTASAQNVEYRVVRNPEFAASTTDLSLSVDNAILLNGVKVDLLTAGCFGVGDGRIGCNDDNQPWRADPLFSGGDFQVDQHNGHTQPDGTYHYHGDPLALFDRSGSVVSPVIGFAADGFPVFGSYFSDNGSIRAAEASYQLKSGNRPSGPGAPGGVYDGTYRDDYEYVAGSGDLDDCNGMTVNGVYGYYVTDAFPHVMACFKGTVDESFRK